MKNKRKNQEVSLVVLILTLKTANIDAYLMRKQQQDLFHHLNRFKMDCGGDDKNNR